MGQRPPDLDVNFRCVEASSGSTWPGQVFGVAKMLHPKATRAYPAKISTRSKSNIAFALTTLINLILATAPVSEILMVPSDEPNYENGIDFETLAKDDPDFAAIYSANNSWVDFKDPKAVT